jgi:hypothetical protein
MPATNVVPFAVHEGVQGHEGVALQSRRLLLRHPTCPFAQLLLRLPSCSSKPLITWRTISRNVHIQPHCLPHYATELSDLGASSFTAQ